MKLMSAAEISLHFIVNTALVHDWIGWWLFKWPQTRWTPTMVAEKLAANGVCEIRERYKDGSVAKIWLNRAVTKEEIETICLKSRRD